MKSIKTQVMDSIYKLTGCIVYTDNDITNKVDKKIIEQRFIELMKMGFRSNPIAMILKPKKYQNIISYLKDFHNISNDWENGLFFKSMYYVNNASKWEIFIHQMLHYITSYTIPYINGHIDYVDDDFVYFPDIKTGKEKINEFDEVNIDTLKEITFVNINDFVNIFVNNYLYANRAYNDIQINLIFDIIAGLNLYKKIKFNNIKSRDIKIRFLDELPLNVKVTVPSTDIIKFIFYKINNSTIYMKNRKYYNILSTNMCNLSSYDTKKIISFIGKVRKDDWSINFNSHRTIWKIIFNELCKSITKDDAHKLKAIYYRAKNYKNMSPEAQFNRCKSKKDIIRFINKFPLYAIQHFTKCYGKLNRKLRSTFLYYILTKIQDIEVVPFRYVVNLYNSLALRDGNDKLNELYFTLKDGRTIITSSILKGDDKVKGYYRYRNIKLRNIPYTRLIELAVKRRFNSDNRLNVYIHNSIKNYKIRTSDRKTISPLMPVGGSVVDLKELGVKTDSSMMVGIHWFNNREGKRVDLDLNTMIYDKTTGEISSISWVNQNYRGKTGNVEYTFTGDVTSPHKKYGAIELLLIDVSKVKNNRKEEYAVFSVNNFTKHIPVDIDDRANFVILTYNKKYASKLKKKDRLAHYIDWKRTLFNIPLDFTDTSEISPGMFAVRDFMFIFFDAMGFNRRLTSFNSNLCEYYIAKSKTAFNVYQLLELLEDNDIITLVDNEDDADIILNYSNFNYQNFENDILKLEQKNND